MRWFSKVLKSKKNMREVDFKDIEKWNNKVEMASRMTHDDTLAKDIVRYITPYFHIDKQYALTYEECETDEEYMGEYQGLDLEESDSE